MADDQQSDGNRKRRKVNRTDSSNDDSIIDLTTPAPGSFKLHDIVDLTAPITPKPVSQKSSGQFKPKTFGDCDIVSCKEDKLFDDDIVIVVSDTYREKKREERRKKQSQPQAANLPSTSSNSIPTTNAGSSNVSSSSTTNSVPSSSIRSQASTSNQPSTLTEASTSNQSSTPPSRSSLGNLASLTVCTVMSAVNGALACLNTPPRPSRPIPDLPASPPTTTPPPGRDTAGHGGPQPQQPTPATANNTATNTANNTATNTANDTGGRPTPLQEHEVWIRFRTQDRRKEYLCPCSRCKGKNWWLTFDTARRHCTYDGYHTSWVAATSPLAASSEIGLRAVAAGGMTNSPGVRPPPAVPSARPIPPAAPAASPIVPHPAPTQDYWRAASGPVITDSRPSVRRPAAPVHRPAAPIHRPANPIHRPAAPVHRPAAPVHRPAAPPPRAYTGPSLDNMPLTVPNVVDGDPNPLTCPVCLDSKAQIQASGRNLVSTVCGHVFCSYCIEQVARSTRQCPQCRKKLNGKGWHPLYIATIILNLETL